MTAIDSTDDARTANNPPQQSRASGDPMRLQYRVLSDAEKAMMGELKLEFEHIWLMLDAMGASRELSVAKTHLEDACMWAVKHITHA